MERITDICKRYNISTAVYYRIAREKLRRPTLKDLDNYCQKRQGKRGAKRQDLSKRYKY